MTKNSFKDLTIVSFESRMAGAMQRLVEKSGGTAVSAPSMKEVPLEDNTHAFEFFEEVKKGQIDFLILMTGSGTRTLLNVLETRYKKDEIIVAFSKKTKIVVRGPKPASVCNLNGIPIAVTVPEPNTSQDILNALTTRYLLAGKKVAVLEYGIPNTVFLEELKEAGAEVKRLPIYRWGLPDDLNPLNRAIDIICSEKADAVLFTSAAQVHHLIKVASQNLKEMGLRKGFYRMAIFSIGPVTTEALHEAQLFADEEAETGKMEAMVEQAGKSIVSILAKKRKSVEPNLSGNKREALHNSPVMRAVRLQKNSTVPIWLMRQAGRYMAEYQVIRRETSFKDLCKNPDLCTEVTISAMERLGVDAAIIFSDILLMLEPMGLKLDYMEGSGPVISTQIRDLDGINNLKPVDVEGSLGFVLSAIRQTRRALDQRIPLIGFAGAPFTMASYMIEGKGVRNYIATKTLMHDEPQAWHTLMEKITTATIDYLNAQITAGADLVQIFDSWVGTLSPSDYIDFVLPYSKKVVAGVKNKTPVIHFGTFPSSLLELQAESGGDVISLDWRVNIEDAWERLGSKTGIQGNLDPVLLFSKREVLLEEAEKILKAVGSRPGFIFNLGHGILPETPVDNVMALVDFVHEWKI